MRAPAALLFGAGLVGIALFALATKDWAIALVLSAAGGAFIARHVRGRARRYVLVRTEAGDVEALDPSAKRTRVGAHQLVGLEHHPGAILRILWMPGVGIAAGEALVRILGMPLAAEVLVVAVAIAVMVALLVERAHWVLLEVPGRPGGIYFRRADLARVGVKLD